MQKLKINNFPGKTSGLQMLVFLIFQINFDGTFLGEGVQQNVHTI